MKEGSLLQDLSTGVVGITGKVGKTTNLFFLPCCSSFQQKTVTQNLFDHRMICGGKIGEICYLDHFKIQALCFTFFPTIYILCQNNSMYELMIFLGHTPFKTFRLKINLTKHNSDCEGI